MNYETRRAMANTSDILNDNPLSGNFRVRF